MSYQKSKIETAKNLRQQGLTLALIAKQLKVSRQTIFNWTKDIVLTQENIDNINKNRAKYKYNTDLFNNPNEITYYLLGAFIADGNVDKQFMRSISITSKDEDWLKSISNVLCPNKIIYKNKNYFILKINNKQITNWFVKMNVYLINL